MPIRLALKAFWSCNKCRLFTDTAQKRPEFDGFTLSHFKTIVKHQQKHYNQIKSNIFIGFKIQKQDCYQLHTNIHNTKHTNSKRFKYALQVSLINLIQHFMVSMTKLMTGMVSMTTILQWYL